MVDYKNGYKLLPSLNPHPFNEIVQNLQSSIAVCCPKFWIFVAIWLGLVKKTFTNLVQANLEQFVLWGSLLLHTETLRSQCAEFSLLARGWKTLWHTDNPPQLSCVPQPHISHLVVLVLTDPLRYGTGRILINVVYCYGDVFLLVHHYLHLLFNSI